MISRSSANLSDRSKRTLSPVRFLNAILCSLLMVTPLSALAQPNSATELLQKARTAFETGKNEEALSLAQKAIGLEPKNAQTYYTRGRLYESMRQYEKAIVDFDEVLKLNPGAAHIYQLRGVAQFKRGNVKESITDFDKFIESDTSQAPQHWQRGISCYYAERYEDGRKQFELHQTVNNNDVENAVWHFLCVARSIGVEKARASLIHINRDGRVPMMQIYALFAGKATVDDVMAAVKAGEPSPDELKQRLFYAHLYLGLYDEATGNAKLADEHIRKAIGEFGANHYMGDVARVHAKLRGQVKSR